MIYPGFLLVAAMSLGIGLSICALGVGAILARQAAMRMMEQSASGRGVEMLRHTMNYSGAAFVTLIGPRVVCRVSRRPAGLRQSRPRTACSTQKAPIRAACGGGRSSPVPTRDRGLWSTAFTFDGRQDP